jgi:hypothetical protein
LARAASGFCESARRIIVNLYALAAGIAVAIIAVVTFRKMTPGKRKWGYPLLLSTFPIYYWVFAVYGSDYTALLREFVAGVLFIALSIWAYRLSSFKALLALGIGYTGHAIYDFGHNALFVNSGAPVWWPEFCGSVDLLFGIYLLVMATSVKMAQRKIA